MDSHREWQQKDTYGTFHPDLGTWRTQGFLADWIHRVHDRPMGRGEAVPVGFGDL